MNVAGKSIKASGRCNGSPKFKIYLSPLYDEDDVVRNVEIQTNDNNSSNDNNNNIIIMMIIITIIKKLKKKVCPVCRYSDSASALTCAPMQADIRPHT